MDNQIQEDVYKGELISYPGPWAFQLPHTGIILVSDQELVDMAHDPDKVLNLATGFEPREHSLRQICENAQRRGTRTLKFAFDHFFRQYRPGNDSPRTLTPDMDEYVGLIARISRFASDYGLRLELSLLSPLEIGTAYVNATGESGRWMHYRKGLRDPETGAFSVQLWQHQRWVNNKGPIDLESEDVRVFAFHEESIPGTPYRVVTPDSIVEISPVAETEVFEGLRAGTVARRIRVFGAGLANIGNLDRVLVVQHYKCPEMDYFSESALPYLKRLVDKYIDAGVQLSGFYSDEMHIQQDWAYFGHHEHGQFALRYVSKGLEQRFSEKYGKQYADLAKYMLYFVYGQEDFASNLSATEGIMQVFGSSSQEIHQTALFRSRYYALLQDGVVDLFVAAKQHAERRIGYKLETRAHATWAESPTIDYWRVGRHNMNSRKYEYTPDFVWSNTVHQAASACHDYFKWGEFLTGTGNDHPEGGWLDRNYYGLALACSTGILNEVPYSYCAHWGHPVEVSQLRRQLQMAFGVGGSNVFTLVQDMQHRDVDVLMLYPLDLVSVEERFGSWTTQYGYANMITQAKLLEMGTVRNGKIDIAGRRFTTLVATFEPFPSPQLLDFMTELTETGGRVIWSGPPPLIDRRCDVVAERWQDLFGVSYSHDTHIWGMAVPGHQITFDDRLKDVAPQVILTDFLVDHIYPVTPRSDSRALARCGKHIVGAYRSIANGGELIYLGYRPRDDQSASLGYETRNWFQVLHALGAYPAVTPNTEYNDNTEAISRTSDYVACRFPNGTTALAPHLTRLEEAWPGGFSRNRESDLAIVKRLDLPSNRIQLESFRVNGHSVTYEGSGAVAFRMDGDGNLIAFAGHDCANITVDGRRFDFADRPVGQIGWAPVPDNRQVENGAKLIVFCSTIASVRIPAGMYPDTMAFYTEGEVPGQKGKPVSCKREADYLVIEVTQAAVSQQLFGIPCS